MSEADKSQPAESLPLVSPPPTFNCHVYLIRLDDGRIEAQVANLAGISLIAENERSALQQVVAAFKTRVATLHAAGEEIPWREPVALPTGASERFLAVHL